MALNLFSLPAPVRRYINNWFVRHNPPSYDPIKLHNRRLYILPTRFGYLFAVMLVMLFLAAINYQNSMGFVLTFCSLRWQSSACGRRIKIYSVSMLICRYPSLSSLESVVTWILRSAIIAICHVMRLAFNMRIKHLFIWQSSLTVTQKRWLKYQALNEDNLNQRGWLFSHGILPVCCMLGAGSSLISRLWFIQNLWLA